MVDKNKRNKVDESTLMVDVLFRETIVNEGKKIRGKNSEDDRRK